MKILGIESSCDETAAAVVTDDNAPGMSWVLSSVVASQDELHARYGGVVPELASRRHIEALPWVVREALAKAQVQWSDLDGVAVTISPGLIGALWVGVAFAKALCASTGVPLVGVNHLAGHLAAAFLDGEPVFWPNLGLVVSGGHTNLYWGEAAKGYRLLATTHDDAAGEAFDKVAKVMGMGYPGGREIEKAAKAFAAGTVPSLQLPKPRLKSGELGFSFSGLKTAVAQYVRQHPDYRREEVAHVFQERVFDALCDQLERAVDAMRPKGLIFSGGVAANSRLRTGLQEFCDRRGLFFKVPALSWCTDNAAMIGALGLLKRRAGVTDGFDLRAEPYTEQKPAISPDGFDAGFFPPVKNA